MIFYSISQMIECLIINNADTSSYTVMNSDPVSNFYFKWSVLDPIPEVQITCHCELCW